MNNILLKSLIDIEIKNNNFVTRGEPVQVMASILVSMHTTACT